MGKCLRLWDLSGGLCLATSCRHGGTVRSLAMDAKVRLCADTVKDVSSWQLEYRLHLWQELPVAMHAKVDA